MVKMTEKKLNNDLRYYTLYQAAKITAIVAASFSIVLLFAQKSENFYNLTFAFVTAVLTTMVVTFFLFYKKGKRLYAKKRKKGKLFYENQKSFLNGEFAMVEPKPGAEEQLCHDDLTKHLFEKAVFIANRLDKKSVIVTLIYQGKIGRRRKMSNKSFQKFFRMSEATTVRKII